MKRFLILVMLVPSFAVFAQDRDKLFNAGEERKARKGFIINGNVAGDIPAGDMANRFGKNFRLGPAIKYKTVSNWVFGVKFDFISGRTIKEDSLMVNITDKYSQSGTGLYSFINNSGQRIGVPVYERGYAVGIEVGKIIPFSKRQPDNGLMLLTTGGFMQHRINIFDKDKTVLQLRDNLVKGYDRLTNGFFLEQYAGYAYFARNGLINFTIGLDVLAGFTQGRRDYLYDVMRTDGTQRLDILFGIRAGWFLPIFRKKSEELIFE